MIPSAVPPAVKPDAPNGTMVSAAAAGTIEARARCIPWSAPSAARMPKSHSSPGVTVRSTVVIATADRADGLLRAGIKARK